ncbi:MAG: NAD(+) diphosphatase [Gammaproteobacteria bacterium]|jgi:NAD+ diphosphatase
MALQTFFSGGSIDRLAELRNDPQTLQNLWNDPATRFLAAWESRFLVRDDAVLLLTREDIRQLDSIEEYIYLGRLDDRHIFGLDLKESPEKHGIDQALFENFRGLMGNLAADEAALLAYAKGMIEWRNRHRYCGVCGAANRPESGGFVMACTGNECDGRTFPRIDPAIIVLVIHEGRCLLGRQKNWPAGRYSTVAGFAEPGESLEDAVCREVKEETNIAIGEIEYLGSQPWPFPTAMMVGFHATATSTDIRLNDEELADARWFSRTDLQRGEIMLPPTTSIAFRLIEDWFNRTGGPKLESLNLSGSFSRTTGERT